MLDFFRSVIWGDGTLILIFLCGTLLIFKTRFIQVRCLKRAVTLPFSSHKKESGLSQFAALTTALAGTMGVGNIVGVGVALSIGGAGTLFWMWIAALIGMGIKYSEIYLSVKFRNGNAVGPFGYIKYGLRSPWLASLFALITILTSFGIGNCVQVGAVKECIGRLTDTAAIIPTVLIMIPFLIIILRGEKAVSSASEKIIPIISAVYIIGCLAVIFMNISALPSVFLSVFKSAFGLRPIVGGAAGITIKQCIRAGVSQGVFSNEAGMGSSSIVMSMADSSTPEKQGLWGIFEVFFDTIVICSLTGLAILSNGTNLNSGNSALLTYNVFYDSFGFFGSLFLTFTITVFAMATLICWSYYGTQAVKFLSRQSIFIRIYKLLFCVFAVISVFISFTSLYALADILNGIMLLVNISVLILLIHKIQH